MTSTTVKQRLRSDVPVEVVSRNLGDAKIKHFAWPLPLRARLGAAPKRLRCLRNPSAGHPKTSRAQLTLKTGMLRPRYASSPSSWFNARATI